MLIDTHCHIHESDYVLAADDVIKRAIDAGVTKMICVGTNENSSRQAIDFSNRHTGVVYSAVGVHPHDSKDGFRAIEQLIIDGGKSLVAIGEVGLDYHYMNSSRETQIVALEAQIDLSLRYKLPIIFHVREAYDDFWQILDNFHGVSGVVHSFTDSMKNAEAALKRGLYVGVNGFCTFVKDEDQKQIFKMLPADRILLETDAPFLTPVPFRGKINEPAYVRNIAVFLGNMRQVSLDELASQTSANAIRLFSLN
ncbi:TatD family hydrolase [Candidatus Saccharibacteria bacterium]|nr:TatD family hydrolase [Candidatus Saccharibacteria bacterium]